jgi:hypothetical protein
VPRADNDPQSHETHFCPVQTLQCIDASIFANEQFDQDIDAIDANLWPTTLRQIRNEMFTIAIEIEFCAMTVYSTLLR